MEMRAHTHQNTENSSHAVANALPQTGTGPESVSPLTDRRPEAGTKEALQAMADNSPGSHRQKTLQAMADNWRRRAAVVWQAPVLTAPVIQGVFLPYEAPPEGAKTTTLESYMRLIKFRQDAVVRTMGRNGRQWFAERWADLAESQAKAPVDQSLGKVQQFVEAVRAQVEQNTALRKEIQPWQDTGNRNRRLAFYLKKLNTWKKFFREEDWIKLITAVKKSGAGENKNDTIRMIEEAGNQIGIDISATFEQYESILYYQEELEKRHDIIDAESPGWASSWGKFKQFIAGLLQNENESIALSKLTQAVERVNPVLKKSAEPKDVIRPMPEQEQNEVMALFKKEIGTAIEIVKALRENDQVLGMVFLARGMEIEDVKKDLTAVEAQLWEWRWQKKSKVILDKAGTSAAGGTAATANQRTGDLDLTRGWAAKPTPLERQQTLIHEASHASAVKTKDLAYMWGWAYAVLSGKEKRLNADSYAEAAGKLRGANLGLKELSFKNKPEQSGEKSSPKTLLPKESSMNNPQFLDLAKKGLGEMDRLLARARTLSDNMSKMLKEKPENKMDQKWWEFARMLGAPFTSVKWEENKTKSEYGIRNADLETLMMFRDSLKTVHIQITGVTEVDILPGANIIGINGPTLQIGQSLIQRIAQPQHFAMEMIQQIYKVQCPGLPWSNDVVPAVDKIVNMNPNWREIEPVLPDEKEAGGGAEKLKPAEANAQAIATLSVSVTKTKEWWNKFWPGQTEPKPSYFHEALFISKKINEYIKAAHSQLTEKTRPELVQSHALQDLEVLFNEIGITLESAKKSLEPLKNGVQWKQLKELGVIGHEVREAWIGRPEKK